MAGRRVDNQPDGSKKKEEENKQQAKLLIINTDKCV